MEATLRPWYQQGWFYALISLLLAAVLVLAGYQLSGPVFLQQVVNGLTIGSFYALIALGYTMVALWDFAWKGHIWGYSD